MGDSKYITATILGVGAGVVFCMYLNMFLEERRIIRNNTVIYCIENQEKCMLEYKYLALKSKK